MSQPHVGQQQQCPLHCPHHFISFVGETTASALEKIKYIPGNFRYTAFDFTVLTTNPHDAIMTTLFLMSSGNLATANTMDLYILAWHCDLTKLLDLTSRSRANTFNRGYMLQQVQIYNNSTWPLSTMEKDSLTAWRLTHGTRIFDIYNQYTWESGFLHSYNVVLRVDDDITAENHHTIFAGLAQALDYTGLVALSHMSLQRSTTDSCEALGTRRTCSLPHNQEHRDLPRLH